jgi:integrase
LIRAAGHNLTIISRLKSVSGSLRERSPGVWQVRVSLGRDPSTHRYRYAHATVHGGRRDAQREAARLASEAAKGRIPLTKETFGGLLTRWLDHIEARGRAPKTLVENRRMAAAITEELGTKDLQKLKASDLDAFYDRLSRRGLSPTSVRRYHAVCSAALNQGVRWGLLERSPAAHASPPSMEANEPDAPTPEEIKLLIERAEVKDPELATLLFVAATTGCRRGELCGLRWSDVDFEKCVLLVRRSVSDLPGRVEIRSTKTGHIRKMALDSATLTVLGLLRERTEARSANLGVKLNPDAYIWSSSSDGLSPLRPGSVTTRFIALRNDLGLKHIRLHHLRHFAATVMLAGGVDVRTVAGRLGHSRPTLTLQTYAHVMDATDRQAAEVVGGSISRTRSADNEVRG